MSKLQALSPNTKEVLGERVEFCGNTDPGRPPQLLPLAAPWAKLLRPDGALQGRSGLLRFTDVHLSVPKGKERVTGGYARMRVTTGISLNCTLLMNAH